MKCLETNKNFIKNKEIFKCYHFFRRFICHLKEGYQSKIKSLLEGRYHLKC